MDGGSGIQCDRRDRRWLAQFRHRVRGLNNAAEQGGNLIIIVNDNEMSIAEDHGGMYGTLARLRATGGRVGRTCSWRSD